MDLQRALLTHPEIAAYLRGFPQSQWSSVLCSTVLYGIASLRALKAAGLPVNVLEGPTDEGQSFVPALKERLRGVKGQLDEIDRCLDEMPPEEKAVTGTNPKAMIRSSSAPSRAKSEKRAQPTQAKERADYAQLIYPEWWPNDSSSSSSKASSVKRPVKPKVYIVRGKSSVSPPQSTKPPTKTIGTSTSLSNSTYRSSSKPLKLVTPTSERPLVSPPYILRPELKETNPRAPVTASSSSSSKELRARPSCPSSEESERAKTVKRPLGATWAGDYSSLVKRSPARSSEDRSSQESREKASLRDLGRRREDTAEKERLDTSSESSISTYRPSEELKAFYRSEHDRLCPQHTSAQILSDSSSYSPSDPATNSFSRY